MPTKYVPNGNERIEVITYKGERIKILLNSQGIPLGINPSLLTEGGKKVYWITTIENIKDSELKKRIEITFGGSYY